MTHTDFGTDASAHKRAKFNVTVLVLAQAILGSQMPMIFTIAGLAGQTLAPNPCYATFPISLIVLGSMVAANPLSMIMQRYGRSVGFFIGALGGRILTPWRNPWIPVKSEKRDGVHVEAVQCPSVNIKPCSASLSMLGVGINLEP